MAGELRVNRPTSCPQLRTVGSPPATAPAQPVVPHEPALCAKSIPSGAGQGDLTLGSPSLSMCQHLCPFRVLGHMQELSPPRASSV